MHCSNRKCKAVDCVDHFFSLKSLRPDTYYRQTVTVSLCPKTDRFDFSLYRDGRVTGFGFPTFNNDKKWFTPAFALDMDKVPLSLLRITLWTWSSKCSTINKEKSDKHKRTSLRL